MISACVNCRDDEATIARWIACVADHVSEIVICDTGSKDRTKEIILSHNLKHLKLIEKPWPNFLAARNWFFDLVSQPLILQLDADEVLLNSFWKIAPRYIQSLAAKYQSIRLPHFHAKSPFTDFEDLHRKAGDFEQNFEPFSYPRDVLYRSDLSKHGVEWISFRGDSEVFNNLSTTRFAVDVAEPLIHSYPPNHKHWNAEYQARKILAYAKQTPEYWDEGWTEFFQSRFSDEEIAKMKSEVFSSGDPAPHSVWWAEVGRFQQKFEPDLLLRS
jgi:glycosyltransferase involved in cell wall biosynthesis